MKVSGSMMYREVVAVYCEDLTKGVNMLSKEKCLAP